MSNGRIVLVAQIPDDQVATTRDILRRRGGGDTPGSPKSSIETVRG
jgi:hypothetical protein